MLARTAARDGVRQITIVLGAFGAYELARMLIRPDWPRALDHAHAIARLEQHLWLGWERVVQESFMRIPELVQALNAFYFVAHFGLSAAFFVWIYLRSRNAFGVFRDAFLVSTALAVAVHWLYPTAPPRLAGVGIQDTLLALSGIDIGSPTSEALSNPVAAVPSLHATWAVGVGIGLLVYGGRLLRALGAFYPPLVLLTIVVTGNHFFLDAVAGIGVLAAGFVGAFWLRSGGRQSAPPEECYSC